ncbi:MULTISPECIES: class-III pyridoxal-phosphate-dependent aminotransferase [Fusobacterium]|uniref:class-III pyridoxal-phosphate-dependent aminotransferase n=1 Tax=Fusobacterium TaxID=848 RepID=UPI0008A1981D|nr:MULTISPECIES: aspartate aminotransferase family protein [Fusobacterium]OFL80723.1 hypothetical protein HMPREF2747_13915 [Fusobacterium sp. HMSC073F01]
MINKLLPVVSFSDIIIKLAKGSWIISNENKEYLDMNCGQFCSILGHSNEFLIEAITRNGNNIQHTNSSMISIEILEAAEKLNKISGNMDAKSIFLTTGSEAVEFALRYGKNLKQKTGIVCFDKGYHGLTYGSQTITYSGKYAYPQINNIFSIKIPNTENMLQCLKKLEELLEKESHKIALMILEPIVSVGGMLFPPKEYFLEVEKLCKKYDIFLVFDESQTGIGRTGEWFYFQEIGCTPDILILSKGLGGGYPVSAVLFKNEIIPEKGFNITHYSSHQNDPFLGSIVNYIITCIDKELLLEKIKEKGKYFLNELQILAEKYPVIDSPRGKGLILGFDLKVNNIKNYREISKIFLKEIEKRGVILQATNGGQTIRFLPSYLIKYQEIKKCIIELEYVLKNFDNLVIKKYEE